MEQAEATSLASEKVPSPVYLQLKDVKAAYTKELIEGVILADYDENGQVIGFEMLMPTTLFMAVERNEWKSNFDVRKGTTATGTIITYISRKKTVNAPASS